MRQLSTKAAWRKIARAYEKYVATGVKPGRGPDHYRELGGSGLCGALTTLKERGFISSEQHTSMYRQVQEAMVEGSGHCYDGWYLAPCNEEGAKLRIILATLYAEGAG